MDKLKVNCKFCEHFDFDLVGVKCYKGHSNNMFCDNKDFEFDSLIIKTMTRTQPENKPLSLEELRQMDNQPVWTDKRCGVVRAEPGITRRPGMPAIYFNYGWEWVDDVLACGSVYAHKPEQEEKQNG